MCIFILLQRLDPSSSGWVLIRLWCAVTPAACIRGIRGVTSAGVPVHLPFGKASVRYKRCGWCALIRVRLIVSHCDCKLFPSVPASSQYIFNTSHFVLPVSVVYHSPVYLCSCSI